MVRAPISITILLMLGMIVAGCAGRFGASVVSVMPASYVGSYSGAEIANSDPETESLVEALDISRKGGGLGLDGSMNDTNREAGMMWTSNSRWHWTGTGSLRDGDLTFTYSVDDSNKRGSGTIRKQRTDYILTLDKISYRLGRDLVQ